jgi:hypothetical protein
MERLPSTAAFMGVMRRLKMIALRLSINAISDSRSLLQHATLTVERRVTQLFSFPATKNICHSSHALFRWYNYQ